MQKTVGMHAVPTRHFVEELPGHHLVSVSGVELGREMEPGTMEPEWLAWELHLPEETIGTGCVEPPAWRLPVQNSLSLANRRAQLNSFGAW